MSQFQDDFVGSMGPLAGRTSSSNVWAAYDAGGGSPANWQLDGVGGISMAPGASGTCKIGVWDTKTTLRVTHPPSTGILRFGPTMDTDWTYQAYQGGWAIVDFAAHTLVIQGTYGQSAAGSIPAAGSWELRLELNFGTSLAQAFIDDSLLVDWDDQYSWPAGGIHSDQITSTYILGSGIGGSALVLDYLRTGDAPPPGPDPDPHHGEFWTGFVGTREVT